MKIIEVIEMNDIFRRKEPNRGCGGWFGGTMASPVEDGRYMVGPLIVYDKPKTYDISPFKADRVRSPAWGWHDDSVDYKVEVIQEQSPSKMYSARSPAWDWCGD